MSHGHDWCSECGTSHGYILGVWQCPRERQRQSEVRECGGKGWASRCPECHCAKGHKMDCSRASRSTEADCA